LAEAYYGLGLIKLALNDFQGALKDLQKASSLNSDDFRFWFALGNALQLMSRYQEALDAYERAIQLQHDFAEAHLEMARIKRRLGTHSEAIKYYQEAIKTNKNFKKDASIWYELGYTYYKTKHYREAVDAFKQALLLNSNDPIVLHGLGLAYERLGLLEEAIECFQKAISLNPKFLQARGSLIRLCFRQWRWRDALNYLRQTWKELKKK
jgi:tetratricopeptide (TPR) repeat protein